MTETVRGTRGAEAVRADVAPARRPQIANPVPIGVAGFALTTFTLGLYTSGVVSGAGTTLVLYLALAYGGTVQLVAGFFALARGDVFPAAVMTSYGAFWFSFVALEVLVTPKVTAAGGPGVANQTLLVFLAVWTVITLIYTLGAMQVSGVLVLVFAIFDAALIVLCVATAIQSTGLERVGGYLEMALAATAWYVVAAEMLNEMRGREVLPMLPVVRPAETPEFA